MNKLLILVILVILITSISLGIYSLINKNENFSENFKNDKDILVNLHHIKRKQEKVLNNPIFNKFVDKLLFKQYCNSKNIKTLKTLKIYESSKDVKFNELPSTFVLKSNKACGRNIICKNGILITPFNGQKLSDKIDELKKL